MTSYQGRTDRMAAAVMSTPEGRAYVARLQVAADATCDCGAPADDCGTSQHCDNCHDRAGERQDASVAL